MKAPGFERLQPPEDDSPTSSVVDNNNNKKNVSALWLVDQNCAF